MTHSCPRIFIGGDSWGCGEWTRLDSRLAVSHKGLEQYFLDAGYSVVNSSQGSVSNQQSIKKLDQQLFDLFQPQDIVIWIQTDPIRDLRPYHTLTQEIKQAQGFNMLCSNLLHTQYLNLNAIGRKFNVVIQAIGGKCDLLMDKLTGLENINPVVPSWMYLLIGEKFKHLFPHNTSSDWTVKNIDLESYETVFAQQVVNELHHIEKCWKPFDNKMLFPDGAHPNRVGHQKLFNQLSKELSL